MAIVLNQAAVSKAEQLIKAGELSTFDANWQEEKPTPDEELHFIETHYMQEYGLWFLAKDTQYDKEAKEHYVYPHGDLKTVQRCALENSLKEAEKKGHKDIVLVIKKLIEMVDKKQK